MHGGGTATVRRVGVGVLAFFWGFLFFGLIDLTSFTQGELFHAGVLLETGWGLFFLVLVAVPLGAAAVRPALAPTAALVVAADAVAVLVAAVVSASPVHLQIALGLALSAIAAAPVRATLGRLRRALPVTGAPLLVVVLGTMPWAAYGLTCAAAARDPLTEPDETWWFDHWPIQAALPLAVLLVSLLSATEVPGRRLAGWCAGGAAAYLGVFFWAYPVSDPVVLAATSRPWAVAAVGWGVALVASMYAPPRAPRRRQPYSRRPLRHDPEDFSHLGDKESSGS